MWVLSAALTILSPTLLNDFADRFATLLTTQGVEKGGRVASYAQDNPRFPRAQCRVYASSIAPYRPTLGWRP